MPMSKIHQKKLAASLKKTEEANAAKKAAAAKAIESEKKGE